MTSRRHSRRAWGGRDMQSVGNFLQPHEQRTLISSSDPPACACIAEAGKDWRLLQLGQLMLVHMVGVM